MQKNSARQNLPTIARFLRSLYIIGRQNLFVNKKYTVVYFLFKKFMRAGSARKEFDLLFIHASGARTEFLYRPFKKSSKAFTVVSDKTCSISQASFSAAAASTPSASRNDVMVLCLE